MSATAEQLKELNKLTFGLSLWSITDFYTDYLSQYDGKFVVVTLGGRSMWNTVTIRFFLAGKDIADAHRDGLSDIQHIARSLGNIFNHNFPLVEE